MIGLESSSVPGGGGTPSHGPGPGGGGGGGGGGGSSNNVGTAREQALHAVEYYNNNVLRARQGAGLISSSKTNSTSFNIRHQTNNLSSSSGSISKRHHHITQDSLYRSNSSLELQDYQHHYHSETNLPNGASLRREYGSHGSIDVIGSDRPGPVSGTSESFFAMLQDYRPAVLSVIGANDQRSPGPSEYLRSKVESPASIDNSITVTSTGSSEDSILSERAPATSTSPKLKLKLHRLWGGYSNNSNGGTQISSGNNSAGTSSANKSQRLYNVLDDSAVNTSTTSNSSGSNFGSGTSDIEERQRRRAFAHYDCQSLTANLGYAAKLHGILLARRRNTTTGASAASMLTRSSTPDGDSGDEDFGDGQSNDLIESCPFFRNEIGGEETRVVSLTRLQAPGSQQQSHGSRRRPLHRPFLAYGISVLEFPAGKTHWQNNTCPYQRLSKQIESVDEGALYYRKYFCGKEHQNWFGMDEQLGPVAISIRRERINCNMTNGNSNSTNDSSISTSLTNNSSNNLYQYQYRLVIRTSELLTLRGAVLEDAIPNLKSTGHSKAMNTKEVLEYVAPEIQLPCLRLGVHSPQTEEQLLKLDEQGLTNHYKVGIMYCKAGQSSEEEMYNNEEAGPAFVEFLDTIGQRVRLKGFDKYKAGLDNKTDSTGTYSVYSQYQDCEIMFHVSTMLPFTPNNRQQLLRKRHIGNDIVTIVFQEPGAHPFTPKNIRSQFQHVFIIVRAVNPCTENTQYLVAVSRSKEVPVFGPPIKDGAKFPKSKAFADFLLAKIINAENAAHRSEKFSTMATRTRQEYLKDLATNYITATLIDTGQKFSIFGGGKKKEKPRPSFISDAVQRGAICWQVVLDDSGQSALVDCFLGISTDSLVLIEESTRQIVFVTPCKSILGWLAHASSLRIYHHQGECTTIHMRESSSDRDELMEIVARLRAVTQACPVQELTLRRNNMGQLGFHVQPDGVVTQVESMGLAWQAGLRQGARLVEICKIAVSTLTHDQMVDLLKTSVLVTVTVIPPQNDNTARRGCSLQYCKFNSGNYEGDYENVNGEDRHEKSKTAQLQQPVSGNHRRRYERSFSPPRSSNSSGYGTGSSSRSFHDPRFSLNHEGTMTSSSSHSSDDRCYEVLEPTENNGHTHQGKTPPPLPARVAGNNAFQSITPKHSIENISQLSHSVSQIQISPKRNSSPQHPKLHTTNSLPLSHGNYSLSTSNSSSHIRNIDFDHKVNYLKTSVNDSRPLPRTANIEYLKTPKGSIDYSIMHAENLKPSVHQIINSQNDGHSTDTSSLSDRLCGLPSEDDLSAGSQSSNVSPKLRKSHKTNRGISNLTPSGSRNQSPRPVNGETARLRSGVTPRNSNRNSANLSTSTLQEDLMKLINPDYMHENTENNQEVKDTKEKAKCRVRENITNSTQTNENQSEVIFTTARPATVISNASTTSSPTPSEKKGLKEERNSPIIKKTDFPLCPDTLPLPDAGEMDWPSLVDTATKAMLYVRDSSDKLNSSNKYLSETVVRNGENLNHWVDDISERLDLDTSVTSAVSISASVPELQNHLSELESRVNRETKRRMSLEDEVRRLREENRRLQDESQAAAHQLRRFTEWFFQTIERQ